MSHDEQNREKTSERTICCRGDDTALLPEKSSEGAPAEGRFVPRVPGAGGLCEGEKSEVPVYGDEDLLRELQGALLPAADAGENPEGDAVFGTADAAASSGFGYVASDLQ